MIESSEHFLTVRKQHTEIKHKLFYDTFNAVLGISAKFSDKNSFTYLDLYAGQGKFSDESFGSPMLALNTILDSNVLDSFHEIKCFFSEVDKKSYFELEKNILDLKDKKSFNPKVKTLLYNGSWYDNNNEIDKLLQYSKWGFIFIDPFSNEIELDNLIDLLKVRAKFKDFMMFINFQSLKRIVGRYPGHKGVANFLGVNQEELNFIIKDNNLINDCIRNRFSVMNKDYIINVLIPTTREGNIENRDNFALLLGTNSIGVADAFLVSYFESLQVYKNGFAPSLFDNMGDDIFKIIKNEKTITLNNLIQKIYSSHSSWRFAEMNNIPISLNIHRSVNDLISNKRIKVVSNCTEFLSTKDRTINKKAYNRNKFMKNIILE